jgi:hypothetical protein
MWVLWDSTPSQLRLNPKNKIKLKRALKIKEIYRTSKKTNSIHSNSYVH